MSDRARADHDRDTGRKKHKDFPVYRVVGLAFVLAYVIALLACAAFIGRDPAVTSQKEPAAASPTLASQAPTFGRRAHELGSARRESSVSDSDPAALAPASAADSAPRDPLRDLDQAAPGPLQREGALSEVFSYGSEHTDADRDHALREIKGEVVQWTFSVLEVSARGDEYAISSDSRDRYIDQAPLARVRATVSPRDARERALLAALRTGDTITLKGRIDDSFLRSLVLRPARLVLANSASPTTEGSSRLAFSEAAPSADDPGADVLTNGEAKVFVSRWTLRQLSPSSAYEVLPLYDREVDYYQKGIVTKAYIERDKATYFERWPLRQITIDKEPQVAAGPDARTKRVSLTEVFVLSNGDNQISGRERVTLLLKKRNGLSVIVSEQAQLEEKHETRAQSQVLPPLAPG